jgi:creatinine amidohydrolase
MPDFVKLEELSLAELGARKPKAALLPIGALEGHSQHLPYGTDTFVAEELARRVALRVEDALVLPVIPYGISWHYREFPLTLSLSPDTMVSVICDICESLIENDVRRIVIVNGHDGNVPAIELSGRMLEKKHGVVIAALEEWYFTIGSLAPPEMFPMPNQGHSGDAETSLILAVKPDLVAMQRAKAPETPPDYRNYMGRDDVRKFAPIGQFYPTGEFPDAREASAEKGEAAFDLLADKIAAFLNRPDAF